eukprot:1514998-Pyramimonas_sp.AAC.1
MMWTPKGLDPVPGTGFSFRIFSQSPRPLKAPEEPERAKKTVPRRCGHGVGIRPGTLRQGIQ